MVEVLNGFSVRMNIASCMHGEDDGHVSRSTNATIGMAAKAKKQPWTCADIQGMTSGVKPPPCGLLHDQWIALPVSGQRPQARYEHGAAVV